MQSFPNDYEKLDYIEPYAGGASILLNKSLSQFEALNEIELGIIQIYRAMRDESGLFIRRVKRMKYCDATFQRAIRRDQQEGEFEDYMDHAVNEFVLRRMSVSGNREVFGGSEKTWVRLVAELRETSKRLSNVHLFNKNAFQIIQAFNQDNVFLYLDPSFLDESDESTNYHVKLAEMLGAFLGKAMIMGKAGVLYRRLYQTWKCVKNTNNTDALWVNY
jgi:DNA adenine methylase